MSDQERVVVNGRKIRMLRGEKGWTQDRLAAEAMVSSRTISNFEKGLPQTITSTAAVARALGVPFSAIAEEPGLDRPALGQPQSPIDRPGAPSVNTEKSREGIGEATTASEQLRNDVLIDSDLQTIISPGSSFDGHVLYSTSDSRASCSSDDDSIQCELDLRRLRNVERIAFLRPRQLDRLDEAWRSHRCRVFSIVGPPGVGKSALVHQWLDRKEQEGYGGATGVLGWSFSNSPFGVHTDVDDFLDRCVAWLKLNESSCSSGMDRVRNVISELHRRHYLLVLDGLDAPQSGRVPPESIDPLLRAFLLEFAAGEKGMCVVTAREAIPELASSPRCHVEHLISPSPEACAAILSTGNISTSSPEELKKLVTHFGLNGHSLSLLAGFSTQKEGVEEKSGADPFDLRREEPEDFHDVLRLIRDHFQSKPELVVLRTLSLFDGPAERGAILDACPSRETVRLSFTSTRKLHSHDELLDALNNLVELRVLIEGESPAIDAHPFIKSFFREDFQRQYPEDQIGICSRIYEQLTGKRKHPSQTIRDVTPLRRALVYGCQSDRHTECFEKVYLERHLRGRDQMINWKLVNPERELAAIAGFFDEPWSRPLAAFNARYKAILLFQAAVLHRLIGRPTEAIPLFSKSLEYRLAEDDWAYAAEIAVNLMEAHHTLGQFESALDIAKQSVEFADRGFAGRQQVRSRAALAIARVHANRPEDALALFDKSIEKLRWTVRDHLYSEARFEALLALGRYDDVLDILEELKWDGNEVSSHMCGIRKFAKARAHVGKADPLSAHYSVELAVPSFRFAGRKDKLPPALILLAELRHDVFCDKAEQELCEALRIAEETGHLVNQLASHISLAKFEANPSLPLKAPRGAESGRVESAASHHASAIQLALQTGGSRWDKALEDVRIRLTSIPEHHKEAGSQAEEPSGFQAEVP